ncbi:MULTISPECIES: DUF986 family protein [Tenebrionibacter/Tenebrionicola group]|jgi:uncharacterized membrane protein YobD (UPF0266 family)|uniref:UPF0266 membrane protein JJB97_00485 n=2 Tax=Tenebrionibacter/Tenebrionicola group TaxID=2969848 RepID=A0A8K0V497_9ENTR|nr:MULTISPECIES: DUF986 family protein [Tenebrionibacter/Tenebrionicola group]MBK4713830.1 DUF986 domain-containing protein [Tenebrionibacter intestinalis]MBV4411559.1 DUF986 domain-containing protein [Tenebrionicola larvae]MBV5094711.1 DUF986 domain-containing protein [Tenebrionicola larvae]
MTLTQSLLVVFILLLFGWAIYDEWILDSRRGPTRLKVALLRRSPVDIAIFTALVAILIYNNITAHGPVLTTWLLGVVALLAIYSGWLKQPSIRFKDQGFFYSGIWIDYHRITAMNLSQDGVLVVKLERKSLYIRVKHINDLEKIYQFMLTVQ